MTMNDQAARERIVNDLDTTLFVEAGAGTGKTTALVGRVTALLKSGVPVKNLVVITFTRAAAAELRELVRAKVTAARDEAYIGSSEREKLDTAVREMDFAVIQTIDSFALSMLRERPLEAGLPPVIEPVDEVQAELNFDEAWSRWLDEQPDTGEFASAIATAFRLGLKSPLEDLTDTARQLHENYHLVEKHDFKESGNVPLAAAKQIVAAGSWLPEMARFCQLPEGDELTARLKSFKTIADRLEQIGPESEDADWLLASPNTKIAQRLGNANNWDTDDSGVKATKTIKESLNHLQNQLNDELAGRRRLALGDLLGPLKEFVTGYAEERRKTGNAEFHDMLTWTVALLKDDDARRHFQERYTHVLVDEFQDTDPLQVELVRDLTDRHGVGYPTPGALFVVGDPKQSIYRFRHADLPTLNQLRSEPHVDLTLITQNFRSNTSLVGWVNHIFGRWMDGKGSPYQANYVALESDIVPPDAEPLFGVHIAGEPLDERRIETVRRREMADLARVAREVGNGQWTVRDGRETRPSNFGDLCILFPNRTSLPPLERALEDYDVPYTTVGNSLVFATEDVRDLLSGLTAIDDPTDQVAVVATLRSPAYACSDADLWTWAQGGHGFNYLEGRSGADGPVARAFDSLRTLHGERLDTSPGGLIERFVRERRLRELALTGGRAYERWSRIQLLAEMALRLADAGRPSLRDFVLWARHQVDRDVRAPDVASNEQSDVVRVMTVHAAKGLEFPIVILTGLNSGKRNRSKKVIFDHSNGVASNISVGWGSKQGNTRFETSGFNALWDQEKNAGELETVRLMYVAATRAKDHLIVSTYRKDEKKSSSAKVFAELSGDAPQMWSPVIPIPEPPGAGESVAEPTPEVVMLDNPDAWERERDALIRQMSDSQIISASSLHDSADSVEDAKTRDEQIESDPWRRGRAASSIGRAVHAILQDVDLNDPSTPELDVLAAKHSRAHDVAGYEEEILRLAQATLETPVMRRAAEALAKGRAWRESYVSAPVGDSGLILEGYVDLMFEDDEGALVIVDYKTDRTTNAAKAYELQLGAYVAAVRKATGLAVSEAVLVFSQQASEALKNGSSLEDAQHSVSDLDQAAGLAVKRAEERASAK